MPARTIITTGLRGQRDDRWAFNVYDDTRTVAVPFTGHPLDGSPTHPKQANWILGFSESIEWKAAHAWKFGKRDWARFVAALEAHAAEPGDADAVDDPG